MKCQDAIELIPWFLNASLDESQSQEVEAHLAGCPACRAELAETASLWELLDLHIPSWDLAAYSQGLPPETWPRELFEQHLSLCPQCSRELIDAEGTRTDAALPVSDGGQVVDIESRRPKPRVSRSPRLLPLAAAIVGAAVLGWLARLGWDLKTSPEPLPTASARVASTGAESPAGVLHSDGFESGSVQGWIVSQGTVKYPNQVAPSTGITRPQVEKEKKQ